jgi:hypothetical protein
VRLPAAPALSNAACTLLLLRRTEALAPSPLGRAQKGDTPLHYAAYGSHLSICTALLEQGADITAKNEVCAGSLQHNGRPTQPPRCLDPAAVRHVAVRQA